MKNKKQNKSKDIFKRASTTHYFSSIFFRGQAKKDIFTLYAFARVVDDLVDEESDSKKYFDFKDEYLNALKEIKTSNTIINEFIELKNRHLIKDEWVNALFKSLEMDLNKKFYSDFIELEEYMYGVAGVIGLMVCKILNIKEDAYPYAIALGNVAQLTNITRDINEDLNINRVYIPQNLITECNIESFNKEYLKNNPDQLNLLISKLTNKIYSYLEFAELGFQYIPYKYSVPIKTITDMYKFTLKKINKDPSIIFKYKVKPKKTRVIFKAIFNIFKPL